MIRTRFAPSPTGYLHIGGVRTALFNWLFARQHGGQFILRIDDTDAQRNVEASLAPILAGFRWLGIDWDEGPGAEVPETESPKTEGPCGSYYQSQRGDLYRTAAEQLVEKGWAYHDYARPEEVQAEREAAQAEKRSFTYSRRWLAETPADRQRFEAEGRQAVVRLKMPRQGACRFKDLVRGEVEVAWASEQDHVIQRADGSCLYHLATVVDDHAMRISHVIRAEEHLSNTPRQIFIAQGLGYEPPQFAHVPFVAEPSSKNKLSKRKLAKYLKDRDFAKVNQHGQAIAEAIGLETEADSFNPVIVDFYEQVGYLPHALVNYLLLLGWSLDDKTEFFTADEMLQHFTLERINRSPSSFDPQKLAAFQEHYMQQVPLKQKAAMVLPYLQKAGVVSRPPSCETGPRLAAIVAAAKDRIKVAGDILDYTDFFTNAEQLPYDAKAVQKRLVKPAQAIPLLKRFREELAAANDFTPAALDALLHKFVEREVIKIGEIIHALRVAATGKAVGFGVFETLAILGQETCLQRIDRAIALVANDTL